MISGDAEAKMVVVTFISARSSEQCHDERDVSAGAAERFGVGILTAIVWVRRYRRSGEAGARHQGKAWQIATRSKCWYILKSSRGTKDVLLAAAPAAWTGFEVGPLGWLAYFDQHTFIAARTRATYIIILA